MYRSRGRGGRHAHPMPPQSFAEAGPGPSTEDIEEQSARSTRGTRCELKQLDGRYDHTGIYQVTDSAVSIVGDADEPEPHADFALVSTRNHATNGLYTSTSLEIKSRLIKRVLRKVIKYYPGQPFDTAELILQDPPKPIFHYRQELEDYRHSAKADEETKKHLDLLFKFVDSLLKTQTERYKDYIKRGLISFSIAWMLFRPGDLVYTLKDGQPCVFVVQKIDACRSIMGNSWLLTCLGIDSNGIRVGRVTKGLRLKEFEGTRDITSLSVFPLKYHPDEQKIRQRLLARGKRFLELQGCHHMSYLGPGYILSDRPNYSYVGDDFDDGDDMGGRGRNGERAWIPATITGRIMIDCATFSRTNPSNQIRFSTAENGITQWAIPPAFDMDPYLPPPPRGSSLPPINAGDLTSSSNAMTDIEPPGDAAKSQVGSAVLSDKNTLLCPPFVLGFSFQNKKWCRFQIDLVAPVVLNEEAFDRLIIAPGHKELLLSLVESHVDDADASASAKSTTTTTTSSSSPMVFDDIIAGKGKSLIILLHGAPGVGKTLTAESIADHTRRPLYMVSGGELGTAPGEVEDKLSDILDIATTWKAVVLLDEADVFLQQRGGDDINRNALVSIFLRLLEYYHGILFLTSNRVSSFDQAFKSRIHIALHYPPLEPSTRRALWRGFLERLPSESCAFLSPPSSSSSASTGETKDKANLLDAELDWLQHEPLNGRQIKNAVKTAGALARRRGEKLGGGHFRLTLQTISAFEKDFAGVRQEGLEGSS